MSASESTTARLAETFNVREILERPTEIMTTIVALAASVGDDEVLVCEAPALPQAVGRWLREAGLELVADKAAGGLRSTVFRRPTKSTPIP